MKINWSNMEKILGVYRKQGVQGKKTERAAGAEGVRKADRIELSAEAKDLQLALREAGGKGSSAIITGAFGGRFDHIFANVYSLIWAEEEWGPRVRCMADEKEVFFLIRGGESLSLSGLERGTVFSTLALSEECSGIDMKGAKWQVGEGRLLLREPFAISNILSGDAEGALIDRAPLRVSLSSGWLGVYVMTNLSAEQDQKERF